MNISQAGYGSSRKSFYAGNLLSGGHTGLKSTQEKLERQQKATSQIDFWEKQKENLKNMKCDTLEEIARKLEMFHTYEDEIAAAKAAYNQEQMMHVLDEAEEKAEKIAEAAEKTEPKTPEERKEEQQKEASGVDDADGLLADMLENVPEPDENETEAASDPDEIVKTAQKTIEEHAEELREKRDAYRPFDTHI